MYRYSSALLLALGASCLGCGSIGIDLEGAPGAEFDKDNPDITFHDETDDEGSSTDDALGGATGLGGSGSSGGSSSVGSGGLNGSGGAPSTGGASGTGGMDGRPLGDPIFFDALDGPDIPGTASDAGGNLLFTDANKRHGDPVLKAIQGETDQAVITHEFPLSNDIALYFRAYLYVPANTVTGTLKLVGLHANENASVDVNLQPDAKMEVFLSPQEEALSSDAAAYPHGQWFCLQIEYKIASPGSVKVLVDGNIAVHMTDQNISNDEGVSALDYGLPFAGPQQTGGYVYWDDVMFDDQPVACD